MQQLVDGLNGPAMATRVEGGLFVVDAVNREFERLFCRSGEEMLDRLAAEALPSMIGWQTRLRREVRTIRSRRFYGRAVLLDGHREPVPVSAICLPATSSNGEPRWLSLYTNPPFSPQIATTDSQPVGTFPNSGTYVDRGSVERCPEMSTVTDDLNRIIGANIRYAREMHQPPISQRQFAKKLGVPASHMSEFEHGKRTVNRVRLLRVAQLLDVTLDWLHAEHPEV